MTCARVDNRKCPRNGTLKGGRDGTRTRGLLRRSGKPLQDVASWLAPFEHFWHERLGALTDLLDEETV
jgi:hypothetical protein